MHHSDKFAFKVLAVILLAALPQYFYGCVARSTGVVSDRIDFAFFLAGLMSLGGTLVWLPTYGSQILAWIRGKDCKSLKDIPGGVFWTFLLVVAHGITYALALGYK